MRFGEFVGVVHLQPRPRTEYDVEISRENSPVQDSCVYDVVSFRKAQYLAVRVAL